MVKELVVQFKKALLDTHKDLYLASLKNYPYGSCLDASMLLAKYLEENGIESISLIIGESEKGTHSWLKLRNINIDITIEQFGSVYLGEEVNTLKSFYKDFSKKHIRNHSFIDYDKETRNNFEHDFSIIKKRIEQLKRVTNVT